MKANNEVYHLPLVIGPIRLPAKVNCVKSGGQKVIVSDIYTCDPFCPLEFYIGYYMGQVPLL